jgi:hypothetical protein
MMRLSRLAVLFGLAAAAGCVGTMPAPQHAQIHRLGARGVSPPDRAADSGTLLQFVNDDVRPHEIYSNDCHELASAPLAPGQAFVAQLAPGPKVCHFQDLLAPSASEYWGTVRVTEPLSDPSPGG